MRESLCDRCLAPGNCCKRLYLSGGGQSLPSAIERAAAGIGEPMSHERAEHMAMRFGLWMFRPAHQLADGRWEWACSQLGPDGRCQIYEDRPQLCRDYRPGQDGLCVHFWAGEGEPIPV